MYNTISGDRSFSSSSSSVSYGFFFYVFSYRRYYFTCHEPFDYGNRLPGGRTTPTTLRLSGRVPPQHGSNRIRVTILIVVVIIVCRTRKRPGRPVLRSAGLPRLHALATAHPVLFVRVTPPPDRYPRKTDRRSVYSKRYLSYRRFRTPRPYILLLLLLLLLLPLRFARSPPTRLPRSRTSRFVGESSSTTSRVFSLVRAPEVFSYRRFPIRHCSTHGQPHRFASPTVESCVLS